MCVVKDAIRTQARVGGIIWKAGRRKTSPPLSHSSNSTAHAPSHPFRMINTLLRLTRKRGLHVLTSVHHVYAWAHTIEYTSSFIYSRMCIYLCRLIYARFQQAKAAAAIQKQIQERLQKMRNNTSTPSHTLGQHPPPPPPPPQQQQQQPSGIDMSAIQAQIQARVQAMNAKFRHSKPASSPGNLPGNLHALKSAGSVASSSSAFLPPPSSGIDMSSTLLQLKQRVRHPLESHFPTARNRRINHQRWARTMAMAMSCVYVRLCCCVLCFVPDAGFMVWGIQCQM